MVSSLHNEIFSRETKNIFLSLVTFVYFLSNTDLLSIFSVTFCLFLYPLTAHLFLSLFNISFSPSPYYYSFSSLLSFYSFSVPSPSLSITLSLSSHFISCTPLFPCHSRCCMHTKEPSLLNGHERRVYLKILEPLTG